MSSSEQLALDILSPAEKNWMLQANRDTVAFQMLSHLVRRKALEIERKRMAVRFWPSGTTDLGGYPSVSHKVTS